MNALLSNETLKNTDPLSPFGLSIPLVHDGLRRGLGAAINRTQMAASGARGNDIFHNGFEDLAASLGEHGWRPVTLRGQARLLSPDEELSFSLAKGRYVADQDPLIAPRTNPKGDAVRSSLEEGSSLAPALFDLPTNPTEVRLQKTAESAQFWMLLHELHGQTLYLEFSRPIGMASPTGRAAVNEWSKRVYLPPLELEDRFEFADQPVEEFSFDIVAR